MKVLVARKALVEWITAFGIKLNEGIEFIYPERGLDGGNAGTRS